MQRAGAVRSAETLRSAGDSESWLARQARRLVAARLERLSHGVLTMHEDGVVRTFGVSEPAGIEATLTIHDVAFWERVAWGGSIGAAEGYCDGFWSTPDLTAVVRLFARNQEALAEMDSGLGALAAPLRKVVHRLRTNTKSGSIRNISAHYDTGNEFFAKFLDSTLTYSCAIFPDAMSTLETAQQWKLDSICRKLELGPEDHLLEIGTGWGGLALHAARKYGCRVTTTTISRRQFDYASREIESAGLADRITVLELDYRDLPARLHQRFDKLVSIEMIEAIDHDLFRTFFQKCSGLLKPDGAMLLQAITIADQHYDEYRKSIDFIQRYIFPGGGLPSSALMTGAVADHTDMRLLGLEDIGLHYATTLNHWRRRFFGALDEVRALGYSESFIRMWAYYLCYCEGAFLERAISDVQILFTKPECRLQP
jgi:cyclopropane-fatty-acyl-phospholipid synthase